MTEEEAKTKWCPFSRVVPGQLVRETMIARPLGLPPHNRVQETGANQATWHGAMCCLGSECMAWIALTKTQGVCGLTQRP